MSSDRPKHKLYVNVRKPTDILRGLERKIAPEAFIVRLDAPLRAELVKRLSGVPLAKFYRSMTRAFVMHTDRENGEYLGVLAAEQEGEKSSSKQRPGGGE